MVKQNAVPERGIKSNTAREYLEKYADESVPAIHNRILKERNLDITMSTLYNIRAKMQTNPKVAKQRVSPQNDAFTSLARLGKIVKDCGGFEETKRLLKALEDFQIHEANDKQE